MEKQFIYYKRSVLSNGNGINITKFVLYIRMVIYVKTKNICTCMTLTFEQYLGHTFTKRDNSRMLSQVVTLKNIFEFIP